MSPLARFLTASLLVLVASLPLDDASAQTIINVPSAPAPPSAGAGTTVNVLPGGELYSWFDAQSGSSVNLVGGTIRSMFLRGGATMQMDSGRAGAIVAYEGSAITVNGGYVSESLEGELNAQITGGQFERLWANSGSSVLISGGAFRTLIVDAAAEVELSGANFFIDGVPVSGLNTTGDVVAIAVPGGSTLTGVLANGTGFGFYNPVNYDAETFKLSRSAAPPVLPPGDLVVSTPSNQEFVGAGQTLKFQTGGQLPKHFRAAPGSRVEVTSGYFADGFHAIAADVVVDGGTIGYDFTAFHDTNVVLKAGGIHDADFLNGSTLNVEGGQFVGAMLRGSTMNVNGGTVVRGYAQGAVVNVNDGYFEDFGAGDGSTVNVAGGRFQKFNMYDAVANVEGGTFNDDFFDIRGGSQLTLSASEFRLNGTLPTNLDSVGNSRTIALGSKDVLSGVFDDGTPFIFSGYEGQIEDPVKLVRTAGYAPDPAFVNVPAGAAPGGVHQGQTLTLSAGGTLPENFSAVHGSTVNVNGGTVGSNFEVVGATLNASGGAFNTIDAFKDGVVNIAGTTEWGGLDLYQGSVANISGGVYGGGHFFNAHPGSELNISGGLFRGFWHAESAEVNISGGTFDYSIYSDPSTATLGSVVNLSGGKLMGLRLFQGSKLYATGGSVTGVQAADNSTEVFVDGAHIGSLSVTPGASAVVESGVIGNSAILNAGKIVFHGGALGDIHQWQAGEIELHGVDFQIDGVAIPGLNAVGDSVLFNYVPGTDFTALLSDGTPIAMMDEKTQGLSTGGVVRLIRSAAPTFAPLVDVSSSAAPYGAAPGQTVRVHAGGELGPNFVAGPGSVVEIQAGTVGDNFEADRSNVLISGGAVGEKMDVFKDAVVEVAGGSVGREWEVHPHGELRVTGGLLGPQGKVRGGTLNISGGSVAGSLNAIDQSIVNVAGGAIENGFELQGGSQANISGGVIGFNLRVGTSSRANISGGQVRNLELQQNGRGEITGGVVDALTAESGSTANIRGGASGDGFNVNTGAQASLFGANFEINGVAVPGLAQPGDQVTLTIANNELFTGTLADGTPFAFDSRESDHLQSVTLKWTQPAAAAPVVEVDSASAPLGVRAGQQLNLRAGGKLADSFNVGRGAELNVYDGVVGKNLEAFAATINIHGGQVGADLDAFAGTTVNVDGGSIGANFDVYSGAQLNFRGGYAFDVDALGATVAIEGGKIRDLSLSAVSKVDWRGGVVDGFSFFTNAGSSLNVFGGEFKLNGNPIGGLANVGDSVPLNPTPADVLTGVLADGTPLVFRNMTGGIPNGLIRLNRSAPPAPNLPAYQQVVDANAPYAIGAGQKLHLAGSGVLGQGFIAGPGSDLRIDGGVVEADLKAFGANVRITDGVVKGNLQFLGSVNADIFGGSFAGVTPTIMAGSDVTLFGTQFFLNNVPITGLNAPGSSLVLSQRNSQMLKAILADGSTLQWQILPYTAGGRGGPAFGISSGATLRIQMIPEPATIGSVAMLLACCAPYLRRRSSR